MFVSIKLIESSPVYEPYRAQRYSFLLEDTEFVSKLETEIDNNAYLALNAASVIPSGLIAIYRNKGKNVPKNLAMFYVKSIGAGVSMTHVKRFIELDFAWMEAYLPEANSKAYKRCLINQMNVFTYTGKAKHAQRLA
jgi:hypothetical protein